MADIPLHLLYRAVPLLSDTFGHSATHVALLTGEVGLDGFLFARIDAADFRVRVANKELEWIWRPSPSLGQAADVFAYAFAPINLPPGVGASGQPHSLADSQEG